MEHRRIIGIGFMASVVFAALFLWTVWTHIDMPLALTDDTAYYYFLFDNNLTKLASGDLTHLFDTRMFYPLKNTLALGNSVLGPSILGLPVYLVTRNVIVSTNAAMLLDYFLAYFFLYLLAYRLTKSPAGSIIAALIYTYNPYMISRVHHDLIAFQWIPLVFLGTESLMQKVTWGGVALITAAWTMQFLTSFYYFLFLAVCWLVYIAVRVAMEKRSWKIFIHPALLAGAVFFAVVAVWYIRPFLVMQATYHVERSVETNIVYSAGWTDYLFTTPENETYGSFALLPVFGSFRVDFARAHPYEHSLFPGIIACLFFIAGIRIIVKKQASRSDRHLMAAYLILAILALIFTLGPFMIINGVRVPLLYAIVYRLPGADTLRVPTRFIVIAIFALSILAAYVWKQVEAKYKSRVLLAILVIVLLCFEYRYRFPVPTPVAAGIQEFYAAVNDQRDLSVILELPIGNGYSIGNRLLDRDFMADSTYLLYALYHGKTLVNGYHGFIPPDYYAMGRLTSIDFPTPAKLAMLKHMGVDAIVVHEDQYPVPGIGENLVRALRQSGLTEFAHNGILYGFLTK